ncbi:hypothetical protein GEV33_006427 [Tenebrio molitor]|uniref:Uncharacterized protein n=1 Tax=Tenebrio molitor TaxID=7067 RepID=A0A8J6HKK4_TENMO|nr:hypothetical protein GEV33_006427 [Tenebrio molitor]
MNKYIQQTRKQFNLTHHVIGYAPSNLIAGVNRWITCNTPLGTLPRSHEFLVTPGQLPSTSRSSAGRTLSIKYNIAAVGGAELLRRRWRIGTTRTRSRRRGSWGSFRRNRDDTADKHVATVRVYLTLIAPYLSGDNAPGILSPIFIRAISVKDVSVVAIASNFSPQQERDKLEKGQEKACKKRSLSASTPLSGVQIASGDAVINEIRSGYSGRLEECSFRVAQTRRPSSRSSGSKPKTKKVRTRARTFIVEGRKANGFFSADDKQKTTRLAPIEGFEFGGNQPPSRGNFYACPRQPQEMNVNCAIFHGGTEKNYDGATEVVSEHSLLFTYCRLSITGSILNGGQIIIVVSFVPSEYIRYLGRDLVRLINLKLSESPPPCGGGGGLFLVSSERPLSLAYLSRASNVSGERSPFDGSCCGSGYHTVDSTPLGSPEEMEVPKYRVVMLGDAGVGKTALVSQFMTSEYMNTYDASLDDEFGERTVSVLLDGEESEMIFIDHPASEMSVSWNFCLPKITTHLGLNNDAGAVKLRHVPLRMALGGSRNVDQFGEVLPSTRILRTKRVSLGG